MRIRGTARFLIPALAALASLTATGRRAWAQLLDLPTITIGIDDYAGIPAGDLARATREVSRWYGAINVDTVWRDTRRIDPRTRSLPARHDTPDLTVIVLSADMADRAMLPPHVVGCAPGTETERGRIAYVLYERLRRMAMPPARTDDAALLSVVLAHEIGHLLLPYGSHSETGIMRGHWQLDELRRLDPRALAFTPAQAEQIRRRVSGARSSD